MIRFLKQLFYTLKEFAGKRQIHDEVQGGERISRYILTRKGFYSADKGTVKYRAFLPHKNKETSVYRSSGLEEQTVWDIGERNVAKPTGRTIYARGDVLAKVVFRIGLGIVSAPTPHRLHANIIRWPDDKDEQKMRAIELANESTLKLPPS